MSSLTMQTMSAVRWRMLSAIEYVEGGATYGARLMETQGGSAFELCRLVGDRLVQCRIGGVEVNPAQVDARGWADIDVRLTVTGLTLLNRDPWWLVLRVFTLYTPSNGGHPVTTVRTLAGADDAQLRTMESAGFLEAIAPETHEPVPLPKRAKLPSMLRVQLTGKARRYLPRV